MQNKAVFIDLDNTLITTRSGKKYPIHSKDWKFIPETLDAIQYYHRNDYMVIILSNQLGIEEGYVIEEAFVSKLEEICKVLEKELRIPPQSIHYHYSNKNNYYAMPKPGMVHELAIDYELETHKCMVLGSSHETKELAENLGIVYLNVIDVINIDWVNK